MKHPWHLLVGCAMQLPLAISGVFFIAGSLVMGLAVGVWMLIVGRILLGFGVAGACLVSAGQALDVPCCQEAPASMACQRGR